MSQLLSLGAINKLTGKYVYPKIANKKDKYICPECNKDLILVQGYIRIHHFRHKIDNINPCHHYSNPTETQIHKDAKILLKTLLENKTPIQFIRKCVSCKKDEEFKILEISDTSIIELEYRFNYNNNLKIADVAYIDDGDIVCIFEICNTNKTISNNRPEPWFEIDANSLLKLVNDTCFTILKIPCIRCEKCDECIEKEMNDIKISNLEKFIREKYIRFKLGQKIYPTPKYPYPQINICEKFDKSHNYRNCSCDYCNKFSNCGYCDNCKYYKWYNDVWKTEGHLRFDFDARYDLINNKEICDIFNNDNDLNLYRIVLCSWKGGIIGYLISKEDYNKYNYWNSDWWDKFILNLPYKYTKDYGGDGTIDIFEDLIKNSYELNIKLNTILKKKIEVIVKDRSNCICFGSGISYWSDDIYGSCLECCCINCSNFCDECKCEYCKKCNNCYEKNEKHKCYLCNKCKYYQESIDIEKCTYCTAVKID